MHFKDIMIWTNNVSEMGNPKWSVRNKSLLNHLELSQENPQRTVDQL